MSMLRSNGENEMRAYVEVEIPAPRVEPTLEMDRIALFDPEDAKAVEGQEPPKSSGPRNPDQMQLPDPEPKIELPEGLPLTVAQPVYVPPELAAQWREEAKRKGIA